MRNRSSVSGRGDLQTAAGHDDDLRDERQAEAAAAGGPTEPGVVVQYLNALYLVLQDNHHADSS